MEELVKVEDGKIIVSNQFTKEWAEFQKQALEMDLKAKEIKEALKNAMEKYNVTSYEDDFIKAVYRKPSTRTTIDSKKLKEDMPDIYEEYSKTSNVSSSVSIEVKC